MFRCLLFRICAEMRGGLGALCTWSGGDELCGFGAAESLAANKQGAANNEREPSEAVLHSCGS